MSNTTLIIVCGLTGSGKTTLARRFEAERNAVRLCVDDWMGAIEINLWDEAARARIEALQWDLAQRLLVLGQSVIVEWGTWGRSERDQLREFARSIGVRVELHFLDGKPDELFARVSARNRENPPISRDLFDQWDQMIERPDTAELKLFD